jgi:hypothetical protein
MSDVSTLEGTDLDAAVAKALGWKKWDAFPDCWLTGDDRSPSFQRFHPSTDWSQCGPIIEREKIAIRYEYDEGWGATVYLPNGDTVDYLGPTPLVAAMRCFVAAAESRAKEDAK